MAPAPGLFPATAWTLVQKAVSGEDAQAHARNELLARYWQPIYVYLRRGGRPAAEAEDLTQAFFVHLLEKHLLERVRVRQVRFRGYLRSVLEHFLANEARLAMTRKRKTSTLDVASAESWLASSSAESPEMAFDRVWAVERLQSAVAQLRAELTNTGRGWIADALISRVGLGTAADPTSVKDLAARHAVSENQLSVAMHRARERLRELILEEIRDSVSSPEEATDELNALFAALRGQRT
ncbi:MAG: sigma-70 family RNA polymerase sigma factor [Gemmataceae bacterium]|nr:sigma-70 family RNA polymerase sigma factor [Gemmataceae bacterium]